MFYEDPNVLYISLHVHMNGTFYPATNEGDMYHCGVGPGEGKYVSRLSHRPMEDTDGV